MSFFALIWLCKFAVCLLLFGFANACCCLRLFSFANVSCSFLSGLLAFKPFAQSCCSFFWVFYDHSKSHFFVSGCWHSNLADNCNFVQSLAQAYVQLNVPIGIYSRFHCFFCDLVLTFVSQAITSGQRRLVRRVD